MCECSRFDFLLSTNLFIPDATPTQEELSLHGHVSALLQPTDALLDSLRSYEGCGDLIRKAISNPTSDNEDEAWQAVQPAVAKLKRYFEYSASLGINNNYYYYC